MKDKFSILVAVILAVGLIATACAPVATPQPSPEEEEAPAPAAPPPSEAAELTVALGTEITTLDPQFTSGIDTISIVRHIFNSLAFLDQENEMAPDLATTWEVADDGVTWVFNLRQGVEFHDGSPFNAETAKWTIDRAIGPDRPASLAQRYLSVIDHAEVMDEYVLEIETTAPFGGFLFNLGHINGGLMMSPTAAEAAGDEVDAQPVGTGPYTLAEWVRGNRLVLERNDDYFGEPPAYERIIYRPVPEQSSRVVQLETGEVDIAVKIPPFEIERLSADPNIRIEEVEEVRPMAFALNTSKEPFNDKLVRQAVNFAVDKQAIVDSILDGRARLVDSPLPPRMWSYKSIGGYEYDPDRAKELLAEAGYPDGVEVVVQCPQGRWTEDSQICQAVAGQLEEIGITVDLQIMGDYPAFIASHSENPQGYDMSLFGFAAGSLDPDAAFHSTLHSSNVGQNFNYSQYSNPEVDRLIQEGRAQVDQEARRQTYGQLQELVWEDAPFLWLHVETGFIGIRQNVEDVWIRPDGGLLLWTAHPAGQ